MSDDMTLTTEELREMLEKATPGPWVVDADNDVVADGSGWMVADLLVLDGRPSQQDINNARLIAAAPALAAEVLALRAENERLRGVLERVKLASKAYAQDSQVSVEDQRYAHECTFRLASAALNTRER